MHPVLKAFAGAATRWLMAIAGAHGVELGNDQAETIVDAALILVPILWSLIQKINVHEAIKSAKAGV